METQLQSVKMVRVDTETLEAVGYDIGSRCLFLKLRGGKTLRLEKVPQFRYSGLLSSPRKDAYYQAFIKDRFLSKLV